MIRRHGALHQGVPAFLVFDVGGVYENGSGVNYDSNAVRPAMWIDLNTTN